MFIIHSWQDALFLSILQKYSPSIKRHPEYITVSFLMLSQVRVVFEGPVAELARVRRDVVVHTHVSCQFVRLHESFVAQLAFSWKGASYLFNVKPILRD